MALSGSVTTGTWKSSDGKTRSYTLSWSATQDVSTNKSTISWTLKTSGTYPYNVAERTVKAVIAGTTVYSKTDRVMRGANTTLKTGTITLTHDSSGNKSFSVSLEAAVYYSTVNCTGSGTFTLNQIPRQATLSTAPNFNDEGNPAITYSNPAGNAVTSLQACIASTDGKTIYVPYRDISKTGTSYTFSLTSAERTALQNACSNAKSMSVKFYVKTVIGGNTFYSTLTKTLSIVNANPTIEGYVKDNNSATYNLTGDSFTYMVKFMSIASYENRVTAKKGATIVSRKVTCGSLTGTAENGELSGVESGTFVFSATDSRGNTSSVTVNRTLIPYVKLSCALDCPAPNALGNMTFYIKGNYFNGSFDGTTNAGRQNSLTVEYRYKVNNGAWGDWTSARNANSTTSGNNYNFPVTLHNLDYKSTYTFQARISDYLDSVTTGEISVRTPPVFDWGEEDFNFNVPIMMNGETVLRHNETAKNVVLSAHGGHIYIRPQGTNNTTGEIRITPQGDIILGGQSLKTLLGIS